MTETETETTTGDTLLREPLRGRLWAAFHSFLTTTVRVWVVLIGALIIGVLLLALKVNLQALDASQRESDTREQLAATYAANLRTFDLEVQARADCLASVARSDLNRGQHEATVAAFQNLTVLFPESEGLAKVVVAIVTALKAGPLLAEPPRDAADCPVTPVAPVSPFGALPL